MQPSEPTPVTTMDVWGDPYRGQVVGHRCTSEKESMRCQRDYGHDGAHRWTSGADGRSFSWGGSA